MRRKIVSTHLLPRRPAGTLPAGLVFVYDAQARARPPSTGCCRPAAVAKHRRQRVAHGLLLRMRPELTALPPAVCDRGHAFSDSVPSERKRSSVPPSSNAARLRRAGGLHSSGGTPSNSFSRPHPPPTRPRKATTGYARRGFPRGGSDRWPSRLIVVCRRCWQRSSWRAQPGSPCRKSAGRYS